MVSMCRIRIGRSHAEPVRSASSGTPRGLQAHRREALEALISRVDLDAYGLQCRNAQDGLDIVRAKDHRRTDGLTHELDACDADRQGNLGSIGKLICALSE